MSPSIEGSIRPRETVRRKKGRSRKKEEDTVVMRRYGN